MGHTAPFFGKTCKESGVMACFEDEMSSEIWEMYACRNNNAGEMKMRVPNYCAKTLVGCPRSRKFVGTSGSGLSRKR